MTLDDLKVANTKGNQFPYATEIEDDWTPEGAEKDCDSVATWKMRHLVSNGWPVTALRLACCFVEPSAGAKRDRYHLVLLADFDNTTWVLDNRHSYPMEYDLLPYEWHKLWNHDLNAWEWAQGADRTIP
jgi:predicted transglutaminase-like cysteine proteinase